MIAMYCFIFLLTLPLISCAGATKTNKKERVLSVEEHFQLAFILTGIARKVGSSSQTYRRFLSRRIFRHPVCIPEVLSW
jgi:hypothetical protein